MPTRLYKKTLQLKQIATAVKSRETVPFTPILLSENHYVFAGLYRELTYLGDESVNDFLRSTSSEKQIPATTTVRTGHTAPKKIILSSTN